VAQTIIVKALVRYLDPEANFCIVQYDPDLVDAPVQAVDLATTPPKKNQEVYFVGWAGDDIGIIHNKTTIENIFPSQLRVKTDPPRYRSTNVNVIYVSHSSAYDCNTGLLVNSERAVQALWMDKMKPDFEGEEDFCRDGLAASVVAPILRMLQEGRDVDVRVLPVEFEAVILAEKKAATTKATMTIVCARETLSCA
jgi:hypothetical protein